MKKVDVLMLKVKNKLIRMFCRKGVRPYMQKLWFSAVKDDFTFKGTTLRQKIWAWKRGYLSYRIEQYGLTEENYKNFLSDYDYHWLNRINNVYQGWINDKTTYRYIMEPLKEFVPKYYFSVCKKNGKAVLVRMSDCPAEVETSYEGVFEILKKEEKLVFKRLKTKELLAFLIDRKGAGMTAKQICVALFPDDTDDTKNSAYLRQLFMDLKNTLKEVGAEAVLCHETPCYRVDTSLIKCDYYSYLETGKPEFLGEYMVQYSWADETCATLQF
jgi:hypothetical protein